MKTPATSAVSIRMVVRVVGNHVFRTLYQQKGLLSRTFEMKNPGDPVAKLPTPLQGFTHVGNEKLVIWNALGPNGLHDIKKYSSTLFDSLSGTQKAKVPTPAKLLECKDDCKN